MMQSGVSYLNQMIIVAAAARLVVFFSLGVSACLLVSTIRQCQRPLILSLAHSKSPVLEKKKMKIEKFTKKLL